jgi:hypothetical protein
MAPNADADRESIQIIPTQHSNPLEATDAQSMRSQVFQPAENPVGESVQPEPSSSQVTEQTKKKKK